MTSFDERRIRNMRCLTCIITYFIILYLSNKKLFYAITKNIWANAGLQN